MSTYINLRIASSGCWSPLGLLEGVQEARPIPNIIISTG